MNSNEQLVKESQIEVREEKERAFKKRCKNLQGLIKKTEKDLEEFSKEYEEWKKVNIDDINPRMYLAD